MVRRGNPQSCEASSSAARIASRSSLDHSVTFFESSCWLSVTLAQPCWTLGYAAVRHRLDSGDACSLTRTASGTVTVGFYPSRDTPSSHVPYVSATYGRLAAGIVPRNKTGLRSDKYSVIHS